MQHQAVIVLVEWWWGGGGSEGGNGGMRIREKMWCEFFVPPELQKKIQNKQEKFFVKSVD